jgi:predicted DNA-binding transcriptional regulator YafY
MSFSKAEQLMELASMVAGHRTGITLDDVTERFGCSYRTAQRMIVALETSFPDVVSRTDEEGRKRWRLEGGHFRDLMNLTPEELASVDLAVEQFEQAAMDFEAKELKRLKDKILALVPRQTKVRIETDHEALLEARGFIARPGPRPKADAEILNTVAKAIKACSVIEIVYSSHRDQTPKPRKIEVYGLLYGARHYIVGKQLDGGSERLRTYRLDTILSARFTEQTYTIPEDFDLHAFANRAFGVYQNDTEYSDIVWKFTPEAAANAKSYLFHPEQSLEECKDGSVIIRFKASGLLEMCWHLYSWGDHVEVIEPKTLKKMMENYRRNDFPAMP